MNTTLTIGIAGWLPAQEEFLHARFVSRTASSRPSAVAATWSTSTTWTTSRNRTPAALTLEGAQEQETYAVAFTPAERAAILGMLAPRLPALTSAADDSSRSAAALVSQHKPCPVPETNRITRIGRDSRHQGETRGGHDTTPTRERAAITHTRESREPSPVPTAGIGAAQLGDEDLAEAVAGVVGLLVDAGLHCGRGSPRMKPRHCWTRTKLRVRTRSRARWTAAR